MDPRKILIIRTSALGDVIHVLSSLAALRQRFPQAAISWLVEPAGALLLEGHADLERIFVFNRGLWKTQWRNPAAWPSLLGSFFSLVRQIRRERFDLVVDFQCNLRSALAVLLSGGRRRLGFHRRDASEWGGWLFTGEKAPPAPPGIHKVEKNLHLVSTLGWSGPAPPPRIALDPKDLAWAQEAVASLPGGGPVVLLHPAVSRFGDIKRWSAEGFRDLADRARSELDARILITWGPGERDMAEAVGRPTVAPPVRGPKQLAALAACAHAVVAADTAILHIAAALDVPTVGLFGPKDERIYGPYPSGPTNRVVRSTAACSPCRLRRCDHRICMSLVFPEDVFAALRKALRA